MPGSPQSKVLFIILSVIAITACGYFIWQTDTLQRNIFPKRYWTHYWTEQIVKLKASIKKDEFSISIMAIELQKRQRTRDLDILQAMIVTKSLDIANQEARQEAIKSLVDEDRSLLEELKANQQQLDDDKKDLEKANRELSRYESM